MQVSVWERESFYSHKQVVIIGAGLAGLWSAIELKKLDADVDILILEKGSIPSGASTRNAGFACFGSPTELLHDAALLGEDKMWEITEMRYRGLAKTREIFGDDAIAFESCGGYELLDNAYAGLADLDDKLLWLNEGLTRITGQQQTFLREDSKINSFNFNSFSTLIENKLEGAIHSGRLVQLLTKRALSLGVEILTSTEVVAWEKAQGHIRISVANGLEVRCDNLLICTNGFTSSLIKSSNIKPARGQILVTSPIADLRFKGTFHVDQGFYYFRHLGNRVLIGGARNKAIAEETTTIEAVTPLIQNELESFLNEKILPGRPFTIENRWSGIMGFTDSRLPVIEEVAPNVFALITCNGMGVALAPAMAEKAACIVHG